MKTLRKLFVFWNSFLDKFIVHPISGIIWVYGGIGVTASICAILTHSAAYPNVLFVFGISVILMLISLYFFFWRKK